MSEDYYNGFTPGERSASGEFVRKMVRRGKWSRPTVCYACGRTDGQLQQHREDYSQPFSELDDTIHLCRRCHSRVHSRLKDPEGWRPSEPATSLSGEPPHNITRDRAHTPPIAAKHKKRAKRKGRAAPVPTPSPDPGPNQKPTPRRTLWERFFFPIILVILTVCLTLAATEGWQWYRRPRLWLAQGITGNVVRGGTRKDSAWVFVQIHDFLRNCDVSGTFILGPKTALEFHHASAELAWRFLLTKSSYKPVSDFRISFRTNWDGPTQISATPGISVSTSTYTSPEKDEPFQVVSVPLIPARSANLITYRRRLGGKLPDDLVPLPEAAFQLLGFSSREIPESDIKVVSLSHPQMNTFEGAVIGLGVPTVPYTAEDQYTVRNLRGVQIQVAEREISGPWNPETCGGKEKFKKIAPPSKPHGNAADSR